MSTPEGTRFCTNCGSKMPAEVAFCTNCGAKLGPLAPAQEPKPIPEPVAPPEPEEPAKADSPVEPDTPAEAASPAEQPAKEERPVPAEEIAVPPVEPLETPKPAGQTPPPASPPVVPTAPPPAAAPAPTPAPGTTPTAAPAQQVPAGPAQQPVQPKRQGYFGRLFADLGGVWGRPFKTARRAANEPRFGVGLTLALLSAAIFTAVFTFASRFFFEVLSPYFEMFSGQPLGGFPTWYIALGLFVGILVIGFVYWLMLFLASLVLRRHLKFAAPLHLIGLSAIPVLVTMILVAVVSLFAPTAGGIALPLITVFTAPMPLLLMAYGLYDEKRPNLSYYIMPLASVLMVATIFLVLTLLFPAY